MARIANDVEALMMAQGKSSAFNVVPSLFHDKYRNTKIIIPTCIQQEMRLVVCEQGFFQVTTKLWFHKIDVVYWIDILSIERLFDPFSYTIKCRQGNIFSLSTVYQHVDELVHTLNQRSTHK